MKVPSGLLKNVRGGGEVTVPPPQKKIHFEGTFMRQTFGVEMDPVKHFLKKLHFRGELQNLGF